MLYDLNIAWSPSTPLAELERTLKFAKSLGYDVVALTHAIPLPIPTTPSSIVSPLPTLAPSPLLPTILRRATLTITDPATTNYRLPDFARAYDLLALRPANDKAFSWACLSTTEIPALISLDMTAFLGWHIHHRTAMAAVHRGSRFEICYSQALGSHVDARMRANFIGNVMGLLRATKGRGVVVSSEARSALGLRGPADVVNLMAVWGLGPEKGTEAIGTGARAVVVNEGIRRRGFRGVVDIVKPAEAPPVSEEDTAAAEKGKAEKAASGKARKKAGQGQKRKNGDENQGTISKRQAKKLRGDAIKGAADG
ncbi:RNase P subunit p30-domain-containing protein, partial [Lasiosphaeria hispida]